MLMTKRTCAQAGWSVSLEGPVTNVLVLSRIRGHASSSLISLPYAALPPKRVIGSPEEEMKRKIRY